MRDELHVHESGGSSQLSATKSSQRLDRRDTPVVNTSTATTLLPSTHMREMLASYKQTYSRCLQPPAPLCALLTDCVIMKPPRCTLHTARRLDTQGFGRVYDPSLECKLYGWGRSHFYELLQTTAYPNPKKPGFRTPVEITPAQLGGLDPAQIKSIQAGATGTAAGLAIMCTCSTYITISCCTHRQGWCSLLLPPASLHNSWRRSQR